MMRVLAFPFIVAMLSLLAFNARAELLIQITEGRTDAVPISVVPFAGAGDAPENVSDIVRADLHRSGQFKTLSPKDMLSRPTSKEGLSYRDFRVLNQEYVVIGKIKATGTGAYEVGYSLHDVARGKELLGEASTAAVEPPAEEPLVAQARPEEAGERADRQPPEQRQQPHRVQQQRPVHPVDHESAGAHGVVRHR